MAELIRGRYEALEVAGRGGQGEVLRARDSLHDRQVALKVRPVPTPAEREAVLTEARVLLDVRPHGGLPLVREDFYVGDRYYLVMDWVEGKSLQQVLDERGDPGLAPGIVLGYLRQAADALDHLHGHDPPVVHGDVKPANLILTAKGQVVLVDFGVAVQRAAATRTAMGTRGYVAPELAAGGRPSPAADVYGLAATAYALLTGRAPTADDRDAPVARALRGALSTDPVRRPASAGELVAGLDAAALGPPRGGILTFLAVDPLPPGGAATIERHGGTVAGGPGPAAIGVFDRASDAIGAALALRDALDDAFDDSFDDVDGGGARPTARMALHTGEAERHPDGFRGGAVDRAREMCAVAGDGQILVSQVTRQLARDRLVAGVSPTGRVDARPTPPAASGSSSCPGGRARSRRPSPPGRSPSPSARRPLPLCRLRRPRRRPRRREPPPVPRWRSPPSARPRSSSWASCGPAAGATRATRRPRSPFPPRCPPRCPLRCPPRCRRRRPPPSPCPRGPAPSPPAGSRPPRSPHPSSSPPTGPGAR